MYNGTTLRLYPGLLPYLSLLFLGTEVNVLFVGPIIEPSTSTSSLQLGTDKLDYTTRSKSRSLKLAPSAPSQVPADTPNISITSVTRLTNLSVKMFEDSKAVRKLITLTVPSLDFHHRYL